MEECSGAHHRPAAGRHHLAGDIQVTQYLFRSIFALSLSFFLSSLLCTILSNLLYPFPVSIIKDVDDMAHRRDVARRATTAHRLDVARRPGVHRHHEVRPAAAGSQTSRIF